MFKRRNYESARELYNGILELDPNNIDALTSKAYCLKYIAAAQSTGPSESLFQEVSGLYMQALAIDGNDIEANFNLGSLYLQYNRELDKALQAFQQCVAQNDGSEYSELYREQFAKAYYNMGLIYDKKGQAGPASENYKRAMDTCQQDPRGVLIRSATYKKAGTNYAVTLEKLNQRRDAVSTLQDIKGAFCNEIRVYNNLGVIQKRNSQFQDAERNYKAAIEVDPKSFFPNYNLGILLANDLNKKEEALRYF